METSESRRFDSLYFSIFQLLLKKGLKNLTMDSIASSLGISKRTLYEKFESKTEMVVKTMSFMAKRRRQISDEIFSKATNSIIALIQTYYIQRSFICNVNQNFFADMDKFFSDIRDYYESETENEYEFAYSKIKAGISEGVFRSEIDYSIQLKTISLQLESLKRIENRFPQDISLVDTYDTIYGNFLYSIVTEKGRTILEECINNKELIVTDIEKYLYKDETEF